MEDNIITINMDVKCKRCGKKGATQGGICLRCVTKAVKSGEFDHILKPLVEDAKRRINEPHTD